MNKVVTVIKKYPLGIILSAILAVVGVLISSLIPYGLISGGVIALILGMLVNPLIMKKQEYFVGGLKFSSSILLKSAIVLMGASLSFSQVLEVGKFSLIVMCFTLFTSFFFGYIFGRLFKMNWELSSLISAGTGICGGSAIAAISPVIDASDTDIAYAMSATFIFDIFMVILFPILGKAFHMSDLGYGLWAGTAVNDTSSVVAAGYAFSDAAGNFAVIVKLTRTLSIIPVVIIFSFIKQHVTRKKLASAVISSDTAIANLSLENTTALVSTSSHTASNIDSASDDMPFCPPNVTEININENAKKTKINFLKICPFFIILFLVMVGIKSSGIIPDVASDIISEISKFLMVMALASIGLKTNFKKLSKSGFKPMLHGFIISLLVVLVSFGVQFMFGQL